MTQSHDPIKKASDRYHARYSDICYKGIQRAILGDLYGATPDWEARFEALLNHEALIA